MCKVRIQHHVITENKQAEPSKELGSQLEGLFPLVKDETA